VAATRSVSFSLRLVAPSPSYSDSDSSPMFGFSFMKPGGSTLPAPRKPSTPADSLPEREREVEFRISASSSISIVTVRMSPRFRARRSPRSPAGVVLQSEACW
jgi:hypothetical protein